MQFSAQTCPIRIGFDRERRPEIIFPSLASKENAFGRRKHQFASAAGKRKTNRRQAVKLRQKFLY
jgi:hypothetical protein